uniref:Putative ovule protein n=1 Tax=Solanum chacoense TaxID=4108 RepID=A0A0V0IIN3_SOLCH
MSQSLMNPCLLTASSLVKSLNDDLKLLMLIFPFTFFTCGASRSLNWTLFHHLPAFSGIEVSLWCSRAKGKLMQASKSSKRAVYLLYTAVYTAIQQLSHDIQGRKNKMQVAGVKIDCIRSTHGPIYTKTGQNTTHIQRYTFAVYTGVLGAKMG